MYSNLYSAIYEHELIRIILDTFHGVAEVNDPCVRQAVCEFIVDVCKDCDSDYHVELLQILDTVSFYLVCNYV